MNTYQPSEETARYAPACVCQIAARVVRLRRLIEEEPEFFSRAQLARLQPYVATLPFEAELLSSNMERVDRAIREIGKNCLDPAGSP